MGECKRSINCVCGDVRVNIGLSAPLFGAYCHCNICRKTTACPYYWGVGFPADKVTVREGDEDKLSAHQAAGKDGITRYTCKRCGTLLHATAGQMAFISGALLHVSNPKTAVPASMHIYYNDRVLDVDDSLPKFPEGPR
ncbi:unnamed protein product, partial [Heterosigma akashiwo]